MSWPELCFCCLLLLSPFTKYYHGRLLLLHLPWRKLGSQRDPSVHERRPPPLPLGDLIQLVCGGTQVLVLLEAL